MQQRLLPSITQTSSLRSQTRNLLSEGHYFLRAQSECPNKSILSGENHSKHESKGHSDPLELVVLNPVRLDLRPSPPLE